VNFIKVINTVNIVRIDIPAGGVCVVSWNHGGGPRPGGLFENLNFASGPVESSIK
jgi:hypothetical protein